MTTCASQLVGGEGHARRRAVGVPRLSHALFDTLEDSIWAGQVVNQSYLLKLVPPPALLLKPSCDRSIPAHRDQVDSLECAARPHLRHE